MGVSPFLLLSWAFPCAQRQIEECVRLIAKEVAAMISDPLTRPPSISGERAQQLVGNLDIAPAIVRGAMGLDTGKKGEIQYHLSFQSRVGPVQWLK